MSTYVIHRADTCMCGLGTRSRAAKTYLLRSEKGRWDVFGQGTSYHVPLVPLPAVEATRCIMSSLPTATSAGLVKA